MESLSEDKGAREIIKKREELLIKVKVNDPGVCFDIDTKKELEDAEK
jgi:CTP:molybdopterin cytidylyltransferase MocA